jgi:hypothetical protein
VKRFHRSGAQYCHFVRVVVVAVRAQRLPQRRVVLVMPGGAAGGVAVLAQPYLPGPGVRSPVVPAVVAAAVDAPERRCSEGGEDQGVVGHRRWEGLAADHAGADQLEHVSGIEPGARWALGGASVAAADPGDTERLVGARVLPDHLTSGRVDGLGGPDQPDRLRAAPHPRECHGPAVEVGGPDEVGQLLLRLSVRGLRALARGRRHCAGVAERGRQQGGQGVVDACPSPCGHRPHHQRGSATRLWCGPAARHTPVPGRSAIRQPLVLDEGTAAAPRHDPPGAATRGVLRR